MKSKSVTIKDVAKLAGVSIATVSRVVNGNYYVGPEVTKRVNDAITRLEYQPNFFARSLKGASSLTIAILVSNITNSYFSLIAKAIEDMVWPRDYNLIFSSTEGQAERERTTLGSLMNKKIDGLILNTTGHNDRFVATASESLPIVLLHRRLSARGFRGDIVDSDNIRGAAELTSHLLEAGHRSIGVINGLLAVSTGAERFLGYRTAMAERGITVADDSPFVFNGDFTAESGYQGMHYLRSLRPAVTAAVVMNNEMTFGALRYLREHRVRVPKDFSIVCFGDIHQRDLMYVRPTTVSLDARAIGVKTAEFLMSRIEKPQLRKRQYVFDPTLTPGESVANISPR